MTPRVTLVAIGLCGSLLLGCGFEPLYGQRFGAASQELAAVRIAPIEDRAGQRLHNDLRDRMNPRGQSAEPRYELSVTIREGKQELGTRTDETATRANLIVRASYRLIRLADGRPMLSGDSSSIASYNILRSDFATLSAENDARARALRELADTIATNLSVGLLGRDAKAGPAP